MLCEDPFEEFLHWWLHQLSTALDHLPVTNASPSPSDRLALALALAVDLHDRFFAAKRDLARRDPALALTLPWLAPLSRALLWLGGWRPCAAFRIAEATASASASGASVLEAMRRETKAEEAAVEREMGRVQSVLVVRMAAAGHGEEAVIEAMERVAVAADGVRRDAVRKAVGALGPLQRLGFFADLMKMEMGFYAVEEDYTTM